MVQSQRVTSLVLLHEALHYVVSDQAGIVDKVFACRWHKFQNLQRLRIDHRRWNPVAGKLAEGCGCHTAHGAGLSKRYQTSIYQIELLEDI